MRYTTFASLRMLGKCEEFLATEITESTEREREQRVDLFGIGGGARCVVKALRCEWLADGLAGLRGETVVDASTSAHRSTVKRAVMLCFGLARGSGFSRLRVGA